MKRRVLVTDGDTRAALAVVRDAGRAGYQCYVASASGSSIAGASRWSLGEWKVSDPLAFPEEFVSDVRRLTANLGIEVVVPVAEGSMLALADTGGDVGGVGVLMPNRRIVERVLDKQELLRTAASCGLFVPEQLTLEFGELPRPDELAALHFPLVIKPSRSIGDAKSGRSRNSVLIVESAEDLSRILASLERGAYPVLLQQFIGGHGVGLFFLRWGGQRLATFAHRRIREKPPVGGVATYAESVSADPDLVSRAWRLVEEVGWEGVAMVEFKVDRKSGRAYLMEINGRFWGSTQLAVDAGVRFPSLLLDCYFGATVEPVAKWGVGRRLRWILGDVDHLLIRLKYKPKASLYGLPPLHRAAYEILLPWRPRDGWDTLRVDDPRPFFREVRTWMHRG